MSEFDHWYTKDDYEALERNLQNKITNLEMKITAIKDVIEGVPEKRPSPYASLEDLGMRRSTGRVGSLFGGLF